MLEVFYIGLKRPSFFVHHRNVYQGHYDGYRGVRVSSGLDDNGISGNGILGLSEGDEIVVFNSQATRYFSSRNRGVYRSGDQSYDDGSGGFRYQ